MSDSDIKKEIKQADFIPANKMVAVEFVPVKGTSKLHLPGHDGKVSKDINFLKVTHVATDCKLVKKGDYVYPRPEARNATVDVLGIFYRLIHEDDLVAVLRNGK